MGFFDKPEVISPGSDPGRDAGRVAELEQRVARLESQVASLLGTAAGSASGTEEQPWRAEVLRLVRAGKKIHAIKLYREQTGVGLKEAKDAVDALG